MLEQIHTALDHRNLLPDEHLVDAGYTSAELMVSAQRDCGLTLLARCASITLRSLTLLAVSTAPRSLSTGTTDA